MLLVIRHLLLVNNQYSAIISGHAIGITHIKKIVIPDLPYHFIQEQIVFDKSNRQNFIAKLLKYYTEDGKKLLFKVQNSSKYPVLLIFCVNGEKNSQEKRLSMHPFRNYVTLEYTAYYSNFMECSHFQVV